MGKTKEKKFGFTLIELLVVISLIGVLASLALVSFGPAQRQSRDTQRKSDLRQYQNSLENYANKTNGFYPAHATTTPASTTLCADLGLTSCPEDPKSPTTVYNYISDGTSGATGTKYVLWSSLENVTGYWVVCSVGKLGVNASAPSSSTCPLP